jgi:hypothetical protein
MNGWFPKINKLNQILSGNNGIWLTDQYNNYKLISHIGTNPFWLNNDTICYNRNDGTTQIANNIVPKAYNEYYSSEFDQWTGFTADRVGEVDFYQGIVKTNNAPGICLAKYCGDNLCYVAPYQDENRTLAYNNIPIFQGKVLNYVLSPSGLIAWQIATGTYTRQILNQSFIISIRNDEDPILSFDFLGQTYLVTQTQIGQLVYPIGSHFGYLRKGDLYYPDGRVFNNKLRLVGSSSSGEPLFDNWIDLLSLRVDLRSL